MIRSNTNPHPVAWMIWSACASIVALLTRNPWYLLCLSGIVFLIMWRATGRRPGGWAIRLYLSFLIIPALMNLIFSRAGETVLLELPLKWVGGPYTLEALLFGASAGIQIASLLTIMMVFSEVVTPQDLLRRTPFGFYPAGVTASIGLSFIPRARESFRSLKEAQQIRGYQSKGIRDLPRLVTPLVILSLEQSISVAESLVSRGWGHAGLKDWRRWSLLMGLMSLAAGLSMVVLSSHQPLIPAGLLLFGLVSISVALRSERNRNRYRPEEWEREDSLVVGTALGVLTIYVGLGLSAPGLLTFYPYPLASIPGFEWPLILAMGFLSAPLVVMGHD